MPTPPSSPPPPATPAHARRTPARRRPAASQYDSAFAPHRLGNWEVPSKGEKGVSEGALQGTLRGRTGRTQFVADDNGHLKKGVGKKMTSFNPSLSSQAYMSSSARWPTANPTIRVGSKATMGYKGIVTSYLPSSTVSLQTSMVPGSQERCFQ